MRFLRSHLFCYICHLQKVRKSLQSSIEIIRKFSSTNRDGLVIITIRKGFIRAAEGTWYNLQYINFLEVTVFEDKYAVIANFDGKRELCYNVIGEFNTELEAQKFLDQLMNLKMSDFTPILELNLSIKTSRLLKNFNIDTIGEAKRLRLSEWNEQRGCGRKGWEELQEKLDDYLKDIRESRYA